MGRKQAEAVGERLRGTQLDCVYSSPLARAFETAEAIVASHSSELPLQSVEGLEEFDMFAKLNQEQPLLEQIDLKEFGEAMKARNDTNR